MDRTLLGATTGDIMGNKTDKKQSKGHCQNVYKLGTIRR